MTILIDVETTDLVTKTKRDGSGTYSQQTAYAHVVDSHGNPSRYPVEMKVFPLKNDRGQPIPYQPGQYSVSPNSFKVDRFGNLELGFLSLRPIPKSGSK